MNLPTREKILERFHKDLKLAEPIAKRPRLVGRVNEAFVQGDQWSTFDKSTRVDDAWFDDEHVPRIYVNECQGLMTTWSALLNRDRKSAIATPASDSPDDIYTAEVTNAFIDYFVAEEDTATKTHRTVQNAFQGGSAGLKIWLDEDKDIRWAPLTIHGFLRDPCEDWRLARWCIFENHYSDDEVADLWAANKMKTEPPREEDYFNAAGERVRGVQGFEYWLRPCREFPRGLYACIVGGKVVERRAYPYVVKNDAGRDEFLLPFVEMKVRNVRDSAYGKTPMTDIVPLQRSLNEMVARTMKLVRVVTNPHLVLPRSIADTVDVSQINVLAFDRKDEGGAGSIAWTKPGEIHQSLFTMRDYFTSAMNDVVGLNDITVGTENRSISGRSRELIYELDGQKNADALKSLDDMVLAAWRLTLALAQLAYSDERLAGITGADAADIPVFRGADIQGRNIRLEASSELDKRTDIRKGAAAEQVQAGMAGPDAVARAGRTPAFGAAKRAAEQLVKQFLEGGEVDADARLYDPVVLQDVLERSKARAVRQARRKDFVALELLQRLLMEQAASEDAPPRAEPQPQEQVTA